MVWHRAHADGPSFSRSPSSLQRLPSNDFRVPLRPDPITLKRRKAQTIASYQREAQHFLKWCSWHGVCFNSPGELDDLMVEFKNSANISKQQFAYLISAVYLLFPHHKGAFAWSNSILKDWETLHTPLHHHAMSQPAAVLIAFYLAIHDSARMGAGVMVQQAAGLRPSELLGLMSDDVTLPEQLSHLTSPRIVLNLGVKYNTKSKRPQAALINPDRHPAVLLLLRALKASTPEGCYLFPFTAAQYNVQLEKACLYLQLPAFTAHSPRAGFASDLMLSGANFIDIREAGRWTVDSSLRVYLDTIAITANQVQLSVQGRMETIKVLLDNFILYFPWWPGAPFTAVWKVLPVGTD